MMRGKCQLISLQPRDHNDVPSVRPPPDGPGLLCPRAPAHIQRGEAQGDRDLRVQARAAEDSR